MPDGLVECAVALDNELRAAGALTAHAVWEELALAGRVPSAWLDDRSRRFRRTRRRRFVPRSRWDALTFAALVAELPTLEALAREAAARLRPWAALTASPLAPPLDESTAFWRVASPALARNGVLTGPRLAAALAALVRVLRAALAPPIDSRRLRLRELYRELMRAGEYWAITSTYAPALANHARCLDVWQRALRAAAADALVVPDGLGAPGLPAGTPVANVPDPFEPLRELVARGAVLWDLRADGLQLYAPMLPEEDAPPELVARWRQRER